MAVAAQLAITGSWGFLLMLHLLRLYRLARVPLAIDRLHYVRYKAERMWWWLGREEFWMTAQRDTLRCFELNLMIILVLLSI
jgi:hypothetical protein